MRVIMWFEKYEDVLTDEGKIICDLTTLFMNKDKEIEKLNKECDTYMKIATKRGNIIDELEKECKRMIGNGVMVDISAEGDNSKMVTITCYEAILDKLKELKGSVNNDN